MIVLEKLKIDGNAVISGNKSAESFYTSIWEKVVLLVPAEIEKLLECSAEISNLHPRSKGWHMLLEGLAYVFHPGKKNAIEILTEASEFFTSNGIPEGKGASQILMAIFYKNKGELEKALQFLQSGFQFIGDDPLVWYLKMVGYYQGGDIHLILQDYEASTQYYKEAIRISEGKGSFYIRALNAMGVVLMSQNKLEEAFEYLEKSLEGVKNSDNLMLTSKVYCDVAKYYFHIGDFESSVHHHNKSIDIRIANGFHNPLTTNYTDLAELYFIQKDYEKALDFALEAEKLALKLNVVIKIYPVYKILSSIYEARNDFALALEYFKKYQSLKDEVLSQENARRITHLSMKFEMEAVQKENEIFILKNVKLKSALDEIESSVRYAKRIQQAILPQEKNVKKLLPDSFILYKPKDIVAGDFYFLEQKNDTVVFAAADCTGHGVPGAMVSVICNNALNRNFHEKGLTDPGELLNHTRDSIIQEFEKSDENVQDGMDISLCVLNSNFSVLNWSGANNPLFLIRNNELIEFAPDKQPIGKFSNPKPFTTHEIILKKGDLIYVFTDGFQDQFGGEHGKKFKISKFKELLLSVCDFPLEIQLEEIEKVFENWKGDLEQVDDVCIIGLKI